MIFDIPVKPYVKKYLITLFQGKNMNMDKEFLKKLGSIVFYNNSDYILDHLLILLKENNQDTLYDDYLPLYSDKIPVQIPDTEVFKRNSRNFTSRAIVKFNAFVEKVIRDELEAEAVRINSINEVIDRIYVQQIPRMGERTLQRFGIKKISRKETIEAWMEKYNMDESDIAYETLRKIFYRKEIEAGLREAPKKNTENVKR